MNALLLTVHDVYCANVVGTNTYEYSGLADAENVYVNEPGALVLLEYLDVCPVVRFDTEVGAADALFP